MEDRELGGGREEQRGDRGDLREHTEYVNVVVVRDNIVYSSSGGVNILIHEYPNDIVEKIPEERRTPGTDTPRRQVEIKLVSIPLKIHPNFKYCYGSIVRLPSGAVGPVS